MATSFTQRVADAIQEGKAARCRALYCCESTGDDANPGTAALPFRTLERAHADAMPEDTVFIRGGNGRPVTLKRGVNYIGWTED